jgi:hypothetical protein
MTKLISFFAFWLAAAFAPQPTNSPSTQNQTNSSPKIQVALLLDTSGSMDGLIEQAKSQLWKMVNELATSKRDGKIPDIEIALYEYGKDSYAANDGYIKQLVPLTTDLDLVSEQLFKLKTNGGSEFCGWVIKDAAKDLKWSKSNDDLKIIIIAGNEPFTQGTVDYKNSCKAAITDGIIVNTIFCGDCEEGVRTMWKDGADRADGKYMCINHNEAVVHIATPYDTEIVKLNEDLNKTYIAYGSKGIEKKERQAVQDANAGTYSQSNVAERAVSKSSKAYKNDDWDAVDAFKDNDKALAELKEEELPAEMKGMNATQRKDFVDKKAKEREAVQTKIREVNEKREKYIADERKKQSGESKNTLDEAMLGAVREQATKKNYKFEK